MKKDNKGFTLVEVMIALVITLLVFLALMQTALVSIDVNMRDTLRDEAVKIAEERMNEARNTAFDNLLPDGDVIDPGAKCAGEFVAKHGNIGLNVARDIKNIASFDFCTLRGVTVTADKQQITISVVWLWKDEPYFHSMSTLRRKM